MCYVDNIIHELNVVATESFNWRDHKSNNIFDYIVFVCIHLCNGNRLWSGLFTIEMATKSKNCSFIIDCFWFVIN